MRAFFLFVLLTTIATAENFYISSSGYGDKTGADSANANTLAWLNTAGNWGAGAGKVSAGDSVFLADTFTAAGGSSVITVQGSGSTNTSRITILFLRNACIRSTYFGGGSTPTSGGIYMNGKSHILIDGQHFGIIEATDNGTTLTNHTNSDGITANGCHDISVKKMKFQNLYVADTIKGICAGTSTATYLIDSLHRDMASLGVRVAMRNLNRTTSAIGVSPYIDSVKNDTVFGELSSGSWNKGDRYVLGELNNVSNANGVHFYQSDTCVVEYCYMSHTTHGVQWTAYANSYFRCSYDTIISSGFGIGGGVGNDDAGGLKTIIIDHCVVHDQMNWVYNDCFKIIGREETGETADSVQDIHVYDNIWGPRIGYSFTAYVMLTGGNFSSQGHGPLIYNNIFLADTTDKPAMATILVGGNAYGASYPVLNVKDEIYNNTMISKYQSSHCFIMINRQGTGVKIKNNLVCMYGTSGACSMISLDDSCCKISECDNNCWYANPGGSIQFVDPPPRYHTHSFAQWKANHDTFDVSSITEWPAVDTLTTYKPQDGSPVINAGVNLYSTFTTDFNGRTRSVSGPWDIGAICYKDYDYPFMSIKLYTDSISTESKSRRMKYYLQRKTGGATIDSLVDVDFNSLGKFSPNITDSFRIIGRTRP